MYTLLANQSTCALMRPLYACAFAHRLPFSGFDIHFDRNVNILSRKRGHRRRVAVAHGMLRRRVCILTTLRAAGAFNRRIHNSSTNEYARCSSRDPLACCTGKPPTVLVLMRAWCVADACVNALALRISRLAALFWGRTGRGVIALGDPFRRHARLHARLMHSGAICGLGWRRKSLKYERYQTLRCTDGAAVMVYMLLRCGWCD